jgi:hypothetical protein
MRITATDYFVISTRRVSDEGFLIARGNIARTGIQEYRRFELGLDGDPMGRVKLYRSPEEVFAPDSMRSFEGKPITIDHPPNGVDAKNWRDLAVGDVRDIKRAGFFMDAELTFKSRDAIDELENGKSQLSNGYTFALDMTPGIVPFGEPNAGETFHGRQRAVRGNHTAMVNAARCGSACAVADSITTGDSEMSTTKITVDGIPVEVSDVAAAAINKLIKQVADATERASAAEGKLTGMVTADAHAKVVADLAAAQKDVMTPAARDAMVADWAAALATAKRLVPEIVTDGKTCHALRREVLTTLAGKDEAVKAVIGAVLGSAAIDAANEDQTRAAFNTVALTVKVAADAAPHADDRVVADAFTGTPAAPAENGVPVLTGREKAMKASRDAWMMKQ